MIPCEWRITSARRARFGGVGEHRLIGGRATGCACSSAQTAWAWPSPSAPTAARDISRLSFRGDNYGYFAPCGYVAPAYYDDQGEGSLQDFTAGFLTTCGLIAVRSVCTDMGEALPLHGSIGNTPAERMSWRWRRVRIRLRAVIRDGRLFCPQAGVDSADRLLHGAKRILY